MKLPINIIADCATHSLTIPINRSWAAFTVRLPVLVIRDFGHSAVREPAGYCRAIIAMKLAMSIEIDFIPDKTR
jgi:hypothetical protein